MTPLLTLFLVPLISAIAIFLLPLKGKSLKAIAIILSLIPLFLLIFNHNNWIGAEVFHKWLPNLSVDFFLQVDSLAIVFLYLTAIVIPLAIYAIPSASFSTNLFYGLILLLQGLLIGFFTAQNLVLFVIFYEAMLLPLYFIMSYWGGSSGQSAAIKFIIYMIAGSALLIAAVLALYLSGGDSFSISQLAQTSEASPYAKWLCAIFLLAFAVKTPLFPFHAWLPDAYYNAPTAGTILLSALLSKAGIFGILRVVQQLFPDILQEWRPILLGLAITGVLYGALAAWRQTDYKRLLAYSSFSHVNFVLAGLFAWDIAAQEGAILQAFNHGITITALFLAASWLEERLGTTSIDSASGLAKYYPRLCWITFFFILASIALPGTNNFVGEILILFGVFGYNPWLAALLGTAMILAAVYMLRWMEKMYFNTPQLSHGLNRDLTSRELVAAIPLIALILWIGIYPTPILTKTGPAAEKTITLAQDRN